MFKNALKLGAAAAVALTGTVEVASAQPAAKPAANTGGGGGDIVITARKKSEKLQNIPLSVNAATAKTLEQARVTRPTELSKLVPTLNIGQLQISSAVSFISLRGQFPGQVLLTISQPVGMYVDSVNVPHPYGTNASFFDLDRVEVLQGPQGTLYGRNTTAGAINIITKNADYNGIHGFVHGEVTNFDGKTFDAAVNIPLIDDMLAVRVGGQYTKRDGYGTSLITGEKMGGDKDDRLYRASVRFDPTDNFSTNFKVERGELNHNGLFVHPMYVTAQTLATTSGTDTTTGSGLGREAWNYDNGAGNFFNGTGAFANGTGFKNCLAKAVTDLFLNCSNINVKEKVTYWHSALDMKWKLNNSVTLRSITGYHEFTNPIRTFDLGGENTGTQENNIGLIPWSFGTATPPPPSAGACTPNVSVPAGYLPDCTVANTVAIASNVPFAFPPEQESTTYSQEFNVSGDLLDGGMNWLVGLYSSFDTGFGGSTTSGTPATAITQGGPTGTGSTFPQATGASGAGLAPTTYRYYAPFVTDSEAHDVNTQTFALFTQNDIHLTDVFSVTLGARYTQERESLVNTAYRYNQNFSHTLEPTNPLRLNSAGVLPDNADFECQFVGPNSSVATTTSYALPLFQTSEDACAYGQSAKYSALSYLASFNFQLTPDKLLYFKASRGFKGGALQQQRPDVPSVRPEIAEDYEIGLKADWFHHRLRTNVAIWQTNYTDKQETQNSTVNGTRAGILRNAAQATYRGVNLEARFRTPFIENLNVFLLTGWNDAVYQDYAYPPGAGTIPTCTVPGTPSPLGCFANGAGLHIPIPAWTGDVGGRYEKRIGPGKFGAQADLSFTSDIPLNAFSMEPTAGASGVPLAIQKAERHGQALLNASVDYELTDLGLTISAFGTNLAEREYVRPEYSFATSSAAANQGIEAAVLADPRIWGVSVKKTFGQE